MTDEGLNSPVNVDASARGASFTVREPAWPRLARPTPYTASAASYSSAGPHSGTAHEARWPSGRTSSTVWAAAPG